mgnify:FL=1
MLTWSAECKAEVEYHSLSQYSHSASPPCPSMTCTTASLCLQRINYLNTNTRYKQLWYMNSAGIGMGTDTVMPSCEEHCLSEAVSLSKHLLPYARTA